MSSTTAMFTGLSGLSANSRNLDVIGNNIANVNTTAFKSNRMLFASQFSRNLSLGSVPGDTTGGTNPAQIGLGVTIAGTQRNFNTGSLSATGDSRDLAIEGDGFFIAQRGNQQYYTRAGSFRQNSTNDLVTISGERVMGYNVDNTYNVVTGQLVPLNLPVGQLRLVQATQNVRFTGNLKSDGALPTQGSTNLSPALSTIATPGLATGAALLTDIDNPAIAGTQALFAANNVIEISGVSKGGKQLPTARFTVTATSTLADLNTFLTQALGINTGVGNNPDGATPGVTINAAGQIQIIGNSGAANDLTVSTQNIKLFPTATSTTSSSVLAMSKSATGAATGESVRTSFIAYDSLGNPLNIDLTMVLESRTGGGGTTWRYYAESPDNLTATGSQLPIGSGTISFDNVGKPLPGAPASVTIGRTGSGAVDPLSFNLVFASPTGTVNSLNQRTSELAATYQDGAPVGVLSSFSVGDNGIITGAFTNGLTRTIGQVAVAKFANAEGLVDVGSNLFATGPNSGIPIVTTPTTLGTGRIVGGSLELSNVDLAQEFINLISASTGYSASSRVITTTDQLLQQLLALGR